MALRRTKRWQKTAGDAAAAERLVSEIGCSAITAHLLVTRGISDPKAASDFLHPSFDHLADPQALPDADRAIDRILAALRDKERIYVHGDYDSDGVTAAALWTRLLGKLGADVRAHVPHRHRDGYDIRSKFVEQARGEGATLIITADCGVQRYDEVEEARAVGIDVVITDHHEPGDVLPCATAIVNPNRRDSGYPFKPLAGVGVAFRLGEALIRRLGLPVASYRRAYGDLAAIGTVTDIMPLLGDNRVIVKSGLEALQGTQKPGLRALMETAGVAKRPMTAHCIGYVLGPRLNAIGRVDDSRLALDLLLTRSEEEAARLAARLERANTERREAEAAILEDALAMIETNGMAEAPCLVLVGDGWHGGVIGIVANRLVDRFTRPTVMISMDAEAGTGRGSARSIRPFDLYEAIRQCGDDLIEFGGHSHAAGFSIDAGRVASFAERMVGIAGARLVEEDFVPCLPIDAEMPAEKVTLDLVGELSAFEPWGHDNQEPVFLSRGLEVTDVRRVGRDQSHLKLGLKAGDGEPVDTLMWGAGDRADQVEPGDRIDVCYIARMNCYNGRTRLQFIAEDMQHSEPV